MLGTVPVAIFLTVFLSLTDIWRIWVITTHALSTALILAGVGIFALVRRKQAADRAIVRAAILGALFNFVDFMINPALMLIAAQLHGDRQGRRAVRPSRQSQSN